MQRFKVAGRHLKSLVHCSELFRGFRRLYSPSNTNQRDAHAAVSPAAGPGQRGVPELSDASLITRLWQMAGGTPAQLFRREVGVASANGTENVDAGSALVSPGRASQELLMVMSPPRAPTGRAAETLHTSTETAAGPSRQRPQEADIADKPLTCVATCALLQPPPMFSPDLPTERIRHTFRHGETDGTHAGTVESELNGLGISALLQRGEMIVECTWPYMIISSCGRMSALTGMNSSEMSGRSFTRIFPSQESKDAATRLFSRLRGTADGEALLALSFSAPCGKPGSDRPLCFFVAPRPNVSGRSRPTASIVAVPLLEDAGPAAPGAITPLSLGGATELKTAVEDKLARLLGGSAQAKDTALSLSEPASQDSEAEDDATSDDILRTAGTPAKLAVGVAPHGTASA